MSTVNEDCTITTSGDEKGSENSASTSGRRTPSTYDVLCGRGRDCYEHPGNKIFRDMIDANLQRYTDAQTKHARGTIVTAIVDSIRKNSISGFLRFDSKEKAWIELAEYEARKYIMAVICKDTAAKSEQLINRTKLLGQKVGQTIREVLTQRSPSKRAAYRSRQAANKVKRSPKVTMGRGDDAYNEESGSVKSHREDKPKKSRPLVAAVNTQGTLDVASVQSPDRFDILCGRGLEYYENPGNRFFRQVIEDSLPRYTAAETKHAKSSIVSSLVDTIRKASPNGFLRHDDEHRTWIKLDDYSARKWFYFIFGYGVDVSGS